MTPYEKGKRAFGQGRALCDIPESEFGNGDHYPEFIAGYDSAKRFARSLFDSLSTAKGETNCDISS